MGNSVVSCCFEPSQPYTDIALGVISGLSNAIVQIDELIDLYYIYIYTPYTKIVIICDARATKFIYFIQYFNNLFIHSF